MNAVGGEKEISLLESRSKGGSERSEQQRFLPKEQP